MYICFMCDLCVLRIKIMVVSYNIYVSVLMGRNNILREYSDMENVAVTW